MRFEQIAANIDFVVSLLVSRRLSIRTNMRQWVGRIARASSAGIDTVLMMSNREFLRLALGLRPE